MVRIYWLDEMGLDRNSSGGLRRRGPGAPFLVHGNAARHARGRRRRREGAQARDGLFRPGRLPLLQAADGRELPGPGDRGEDAPPLHGHRAQHLGRPRSHLDRRQAALREAARRRAQGAVHADADLPRRERRRGAARPQPSSARRAALRLPQARTRRHRFRPPGCSTRARSPRSGSPGHTRRP